MQTHADNYQGPRCFPKTKLYEWHYKNTAR
jgi:hypothetical protein